MGDREARILGAGDKITVGEVEYTLRPVVAKHLCDLEREALRYYIRNYISTLSEHADLMCSGEDPAEFIRGAVMEAAKWSLHDIEQKDVYSTAKVPVNNKLKKLVEEVFGEIAKDDDDIVRALTNTALDQGSIKPEQVKKATGKLPFRGRVRYDQWWITACIEGQISFIVSSLQFEHKDVTKADVEKWSFDKIAEAARKVEGITSPDMGNM